MQPHSAVAFLGQLNQLPQVRHLLASRLDLQASARYPLTSAMPTLRWLLTLYVTKLFLWLCSWLHGPVLLPSHDCRCNSVAPYSTFPAGPPFVMWRYLGAALSLQDPILSPLLAIVFMFLDSEIHLPQPGSPSLFLVSKPHVIILQRLLILFSLHRCASNVLCFPPAWCPDST